MSYFQKFIQAAESTNYGNNHEVDPGAVMRMIYIIMYSPQKSLKEVDFNSFTQAELEQAIEELHWYEPDEVSDEGHSNIGNPIVEVNRAAHINQLMDTCHPAQKRRFF
ncbi:hypothetical protein GLW08_20320 [Pontibacillus yanchengensis]|uniref:Uncharacterized protein n=2 Tax=Pontibacillus yanchengensis TaxID=462910 RepID=A0ACC7VME2_9BACI|nr:hypothetical protein [Pontibacillus yanchengensis]MYL35451.1 hypothetical protein [Pontibacillus yanchengensis]MYL55651.1 hypothetical protein [Pontibacillus yanchengensis]